MRSLSIALINNMADGALEATDRQFRDALTRASAGIDFRIRVFLLPDQARSDRALAYARTHCDEINDLWSCAHVDGLIVTGTEPTSASIEDEPSWPLLTQLFQWGEAHATSALFSCHAAHAAVQFFDGIRRRPLPRKLFGLYECEKVTEDAVVKGEPRQWVVPQSRYNDLSEAALSACGYRILSRSDEVGADVFTREAQCFFLFVQGHPEYDAAALLREYRRDIRRYLAGQRESYPDIPCGYFSPADAEKFEAFSLRAREKRELAVLSEFPLVEPSEQLQGNWSKAASRLYRNWLELLVERSAESPAPFKPARQL
jgi:homoserine O-succinyltransferase